MRFKGLRELFKKEKGINYILCCGCRSSFLFYLISSVHITILMNLRIAYSMESYISFPDLEKDVNGRSVCAYSDSKLTSTYFVKFRLYITYIWINSIYLNNISKKIPLGYPEKWYGRWKCYYSVKSVLQSD